MTAEKLFEMIGDADAELIADASGENIRRKHPAWLRWGAAAACICILAAGALGIFLHPAVNGGGYAPGGSWPEGVDPKTADEEACLMEHALSRDTQDRWIAYLEGQGIVVD